jgi:hypothetical protein
MEPEGFESPPTRRILENTLVKRPRPRHSQCRGRGFESHHLHERPGHGLEWDPRRITERFVALRGGLRYGSGIPTKGPGHGSEVANPTRLSPRRSLRDHIDFSTCSALPCRVSVLPYRSN